MFSSRALALLLGAGVTAGCSVGPDYQRPDAPLADHYQGQAAVEQRHAASTADLATWWEGFGDPQLTRFVRLALAQNLDLQQASARVAQAHAALGAASAELLPSGTASGQAAKVYQSVETPLGQLLNATPDFNRWGGEYEANLSVGWEVDVFGGLRRAREAAVDDYHAAQADAVAARLAVAAQTADVYITIRGLQARLDVAQRQVRTEEDLLSKVELLYGKGLAARREVQQAAGELSEVQATVPVLQSSLDTAMNALDVMLGVPPGTNRAKLADAAAIPAAPQVASIGSPSDLLRRRPDLIVAERRLAAANARIGVAVAEYYPKFSLGALLGSATSVASGNLFSSGANQLTGVAGLHWRLFDFGRINAQIELARGEDAEALAVYRQSVLRATEDVENAFSALVNRENQAATLVEGEGSLAQARESSFAAYQKGVASLIEVLHADETLLRTSDAKAQAQTESARAAVAVFKALGGSWEPAPLAYAASTSRRKS